MSGSDHVTVDYAGAGVTVRADLLEAHETMLEYIASPGAWFTGAERVAIAEESRNAGSCSLCAARKESVSPEHPEGEHDAVTALPPALVEVIHRVRVDSGRLSPRLLEQALAAGVTEEEYVETIGIVTMTAGMDYFCRALGVPVNPIPEAKPGAPTRHRPASAKPGTAWVSMIAPEDADGPEATLYPDLPMVPNIARALSLVPDHSRALQRLSATHYVSLSDLRNPSVGRDLDRMQIELVASRVSALNECFY